MMDVKTGTVLGNDTPEMIIVNRVWDNNTTYDQRKAFIEVTLHNSRAAEDMRLFGEVQELIQEALKNG